MPNCVYPYLCGHYDDTLKPCTLATPVDTKYQSGSPAGSWIALTFTWDSHSVSVQVCTLSYIRCTNISGYLMDSNRFSLVVSLLYSLDTSSFHSISF